MSLVEMRNRIVQGLQDSISAPLAKHVNIEPHGGRFNEKELLRWAKNSPSLVVSCLGVSGSYESGGLTTIAITQWAIFIVCTDMPGLRRDALALAMLEQVAKAVPLNRWDNYEHAHGRAKNTKGENLYTSSLDAHRVALWAYTWTQDVELVSLALDDLADFETLNIDYDMVDDVTQTDATDRVEFSS